MKFSRSICIFSVVFITLALAGCSAKQNSTQRQIGAIDAIRTKLDLPDLPLKFVGITDMANSPSGGLKVVQFQDTQGRNFFVEPGTDQVVEIDARSGLSGISPNAPLMSEADITAQAHQFIAAAIPGFETLQAGWMYEAGNKGDNYFFSWYGASTASASAAGAMNRPFAQIGIHKSGYLFVYYSTLLLEK
ncbi:MAG: hypothetical protein ABSA01_11145 [Anaerolineales bacterium]